MLRRIQDQWFVIAYGRASERAQSGLHYDLSLTPLIPLAMAKRDRVLKPSRIRVVYIYTHILYAYIISSVVVTLRSLRSVLRR